jgi:hypothetical protein
MAKLVTWGASRDQGRRLLALALSLAVNAALLGVIAIRVAPAERAAEPPPVNVVLMPRPTSRPAPHAPRHEPRTRTVAPGLPVMPADGAQASAPSTSGLPPPLVEGRWAVDPRIVSQDAARTAMRRDNWRQVCFGLKGVLSTKEKDMCERFWAKGHVPLP